MPALPRTLLASLALLCSISAHATDPACPITLDQEDPSSIRQHQEKADEGDVCAQFNLGFFHYTRQEYELSEQWYAKAAEQGDARAAFEIAILYRDTLLPGDDSQRRQWMEKSANMGLDLAQIELAIDHLEKREDQSELITAMEWFEKAAKQNNAQAQYVLSELYWSNERGPQDMAAGDDSDPEMQRAMHFASDNQKAAQWLCKAAMNDYPQAQYTLSNAYSIGRGDVPPSQVQRQLWLEKAAANGDEDAINSLDTRLEAWYTTAEKWVKRQLVTEEATCPEGALEVEH